MAVIETTSAHQYAATVRSSLTRALAGDGKLGADILGLEGMSGKKYRIFVNNLVGAIADARYLEVGVYKGSTLCSAIYKNDVTAFAIDNWAQFGGPADQFFANVTQFKGNASVSFVDSDFRKIDFSGIGKYNVYLFDGPHKAEDQYDGLNLALPALDDQFVFIVDDWNWEQVRLGTLNAIAEVGVQLDFAVEIRTTLNNFHAPVFGPASDWHNGYFIAACSKPTKIQVM